MKKMRRLVVFQWKRPNRETHLIYFLAKLVSFMPVLILSDTVAGTYNVQEHIFFDI